MATPERRRETRPLGIVRVRIVPMQAEDLPQILAIERRSFTTPWSLAHFQSQLDSKVHAYNRVALSPQVPGREVLGYLCAWLVADEVHLLNVAVHPDHRRQGIATRLVRSLVRESRRRKARRIFLEVRTSNTAARRLYGKLGFRVVAVRHQYYWDPAEDALVMQRELEGP